MSGGVVAHTGTLPAPVLHQIVIEQYQQCIRMDKAPRLVDDTQPVRVTVRGDAQVAAAVNNIVAERRKRPRVRCGEFPAEQGVMPVMNDLQITAAGHQDGPQAGLAHTVHRVKRHFESCSLDGVGVDQGEDAVNIVIGGVVLPDESLPQGLVIVHASDLCLVDLRDLCLDPVRHAAVRIPASCREDLYPVVDCGIMAGRHHHAVGHPLRLDHIHDQRGGRRAVHHQRPEAIARQDFGDPVGRFLCKKPSVISDAEFFSRIPLFRHQAAESRRQQTEICLCEFIRDYRSPAACSEMNHLSAPLSSAPSTTSALQWLPAGRIGSLSTRTPSAVMLRTPFSTPSGLLTWIV